MTKEDSKEIIVVVGPTASGKSDYAIRLAHEIDGEIISADSRQVYRGMDMGTGKVTRDPVASHPELVEGSAAVPADASHPELVEGSQLKEEKENGADSSTRRLARNDTFVSSDIRHHLLDVASPKHSYNVTHFVRDAKQAIAEIRKRGKVPIICGGTNFWIEALVFGTKFPEVKPNTELRKKLGKKETRELFQMLESEDPERAASIDPHNKIRLIRALEIIQALGRVPRDGIKNQESRMKQGDDFRFIGIDISREQLRKNIEIRLEKRLKKGMIEEVENLRKSGISWKRLEAFGLEYRWIARFLQGKITKEEMRRKLATDIYHYAKRQMTFLRRLERRGIEIEWIDATE